MKYSYIFIVAFIISMVNLPSAFAGSGRIRMTNIENDDPDIKAELKKGNIVTAIEESLIEG